MNFFTLTSIEFKKIKGSKILFILLAAAVILWIPSVLNADLNFGMQAEGISPEHNFLIQGFLAMSWFMFPAGMVVSTVLLNQTERTDRGLLKMLSLPIDTKKLCLAKFTVLLALSAMQIVLMTAMYYAAAAAAGKMQDYSFLLPLPFVWKEAGLIFLSSIPMLTFFWMLSVCIQNPAFSIGAGLASVVPCVLAINTKAWSAYPVCYPLFVVTAEYGKLAEYLDFPEVKLVPLLPAAAAITLFCSGISCSCFGRAERNS